LDSGGKSFAILSLSSRLTEIPSKSWYEIGPSYNQQLNTIEKCKAKVLLAIVWPHYSLGAPRAGKVLHKSERENMGHIP
jgi:hypothetical protein